MTEPSEFESRPSWWRRHPILLTGAIFLLLFLAFVAATRKTAQNEIDRELARIEAEGLPTDLIALDLWYERPAGPNAADVYGEAFAKLRNTRSADTNLPVAGKAQMPGLGEPLPETMKEAMRLYLKENQDARELLRQAAEIEHSRYPINLTSGLNTTLSHLDHIKSAVQLLRIETMLAVAEGDMDKAILAIHDSLAASNSLAQEPILFSWLFRVAGHSTAAGSLEHILNPGPLDRRQLEQLSALFAPPHPEAELHRVLAGERCFGMELFESPATFAGGQVGIPGTVTRFHEVTGLLNRDFLFYLEILGAQVEAAKTSFSQQLEVADQQAELLEKNSFSLFRLLSTMMIPALQKVPEKAAALKATLNGARIALAIELYRLDHHDKIPSSLEDLVPNYLAALPEDPFTGEAMIFRRTEPGYILYSRGPDEEDDGGVRPQRSSRGAGGTDIVFEVRR